MKNTCEIIRSFTKECTDTTNLARMMPIERMGEVSKFNGNPPRQRPLVIGIGINEEVTVAYPKGVYGEYGFHEVAAGYILKNLGNRLIMKLHGYVGPEQTGEKKSIHTIRIYKMHPHDLEILGGTSCIEMLRQDEPWEMGKVEPENYVTNNVAQTLLTSISAERLDILLSPPSSRIYRVKTKINNLVANHN